MRFKTLCTLAAAVVVTMAAVAATPASAQASAQRGDTVLKPADTVKLLPATVYYKGQSAPTQLRNSGGVKFADGYYLLATLVDTSGYSSDVASKYQGYFITEVPVRVSGQALPAGVYGVGMVGHQFVVTDVGGHDVLALPAGLDDSIKHPMPLQFLTTGGDYRLYLGRQFVTVSR
jgi:hypothetical protein